MDNYEEKYKAALGWMQSLYGGLHGATKVDAEHYFPELKESEDERIRKKLICFVENWKNLSPNSPFDDYAVYTSDSGECDKILAWLEKQQSFDKDKLAKGFATSIMNWLDANTSEGKMCLSNMECEDIENAVRNADWNKIYAYMRKKLEKQGEQPTDKVEPKFKVGDWLQYRHAEPFLVEEITEQGYCNGDSCLPFECEDEIHLWSINDAKDGDVLVPTTIRNCPFIYRKTDHNNNLAYFYAGIDGNGNFCEGCIKSTLYHFGSASNVAPATKEQRDLLFQKMKEAGWEWDCEKKELKKTEPKMLNADEVINWLDDNS